MILSPCRGLPIKAVLLLDLLPSKQQTGPPSLLLLDKLDAAAISDVVVRAW